MGIFNTVFGKTAPKVAEGASDPAELVRKEELTNRANIISPFGGRTISKDPSGRTTVSLDESQFQKQIRGLQEQKALGFFSGGGDFGKEATTKALFEQQQSLLAPSRERESRALETSLSLKGLPIGSEAFAGAEERLRASTGFQDRQMALEAILKGGTESRAERTQQLGEFTSDVGGQSFLKGLTNVQPVNVAGIFQQADQQKLARAEQENNRRTARFKVISKLITDAGKALAPTPTTAPAPAGLPQVPSSQLNTSF